MRHLIGTAPPTLSTFLTTRRPFVGLTFASTTSRINSHGGDAPAQMRISFSWDLGAHRPLFMSLGPGVLAHSGPFRYTY